MAHVVVCMAGKSSGPAVCGARGEEAWVAPPVTLAPPLTLPASTRTRAGLGCIMVPTRSYRQCGCTIRRAHISVATAGPETSMTLTEPRWQRIEAAQKASEQRAPLPHSNFELRKQASHH